MSNGSEMPPLCCPRQSQHHPLMQLFVFYNEDIGGEIKPSHLFILLLFFGPLQKIRLLMIFQYA